MDFDLTLFDLEVLKVLKKILMLNVVKVESFFDDDNDEYYDYLYKYKNYDLDSIIRLVYMHENDMIFDSSIVSVLTDKSILQVYLNILVIKGYVVINNNINGNDTYRYVPTYMQDSSYTHNYAEIFGDHPDSILLISDTHIGSKYEDFDLIKRVFDYAIEKYNVDSVLHLGDVFHGIRLDKGEYAGYSINDPEVQEILYSQIDSFVKNFPDYLKVIAVEGNHDLNIINLLKSNRLFMTSLNEHYFNIVKDNFHLIKKRDNGHPIELGDFKIHINHELQFNIFFPYVKTYEIDNINELLMPFTKYNDHNVDLYLSGHFHNQMDYSLDDDNNITRRIYEVVPSLSKIENDGCVAKILKFLYDDDGNTIGYNIIPLFSIDSKSIFEGEVKTYKSNSEIIRSRCYINK